MTSSLRLCLPLLILALPLAACSADTAASDDDGPPAEIDSAGIPDATGTSADEVVTSACSADRITCLAYGQTQPEDLATFTIDSDRTFGNGNKVRVCVRKRSPERGEVFCKSFKMQSSASSPRLFTRRVLFAFPAFPNVAEGTGLYNVSIADDADRTHPLVLKTFEFKLTVD